MKRPNDTPIELANAIADGEAVDWDEHETDGELSGTVRHMRALSLIGAVHEQENSTGSLDQWASKPELREFIDERTTEFRWGHLDVLEKVGEGAYGEVYRAYDPQLRTEVALKLLKAGGPERVRAFVSEGRKLAKVRHPNVVTIHGIGCHDGRHGIWMELVEGTTLEEVIRKEGKRSAEEAATIGTSISSALAAVHQQGLIHRDVKTSNVKRDPEGRIVLLDFSLTSDCDAEEARGGGTPPYMAPELLAGGQPSVASDTYSLGVVLYRLVSNAVPIEGDNCAEILARHQQGLAIPLRDRRADLPADFVAIVDRALAPLPDERFQSAGEMEMALRSHQGLTTGPIERPRPGPSPLRWILGMSAVGIAAAAALILPGMLAPFEVEASLFKTQDLVDERLRAGSTIVPGDQLFLEIEGTKDMYVYIVDEDEAGDTFLLFPLGGFEAQNPLLAGVRHQLPGRLEGEDHFWNVTSSGGTETILVVASKKPQPELERLIAQFPPAGSGTVAAIDEPGIVGKLRGIGGLSARTKRPQPTSGSQLPQVVVTASEKSGVWLWEMLLSSPAKEG